MEQKQKPKLKNLTPFIGKPWSALATLMNDSYKPKPLYKQSRTDSKTLKVMDPSVDIPLSSLDLSQHYGFPWANWITEAQVLDPAKQTTVPQVQNSDSRVTRLPLQDMGLFGICPENDSFLGVLCQICGAVVKAQGLQRHLQIRHPSDESALLPPPQTPVKKSKTVNIKSKREPVLITPIPAPLPAPPTMPPPIVHSTESSMPGYKPILPAARKLVETPLSTTTVSNIACIPAVVATEPNPVLSNVLPRRKSPNISSDRKSTQKVRDKGYESDSKQVANKEESKHSHNRHGHNSKTSSTLKKGTVGRTKDFNKLVAEHRATKETLHLEQTKSKAQSVLKTVVPTPTESSDSGLSSSSSSSQSSHPASQETSPTVEVAAVPPPLLIPEPLSPVHIYPVVKSIPSTSNPVTLASKGTADTHVKPTGRHSRTASPVCLNTIIPAAKCDTIPVLTCTPRLPQVRNVVSSTVSIAAATNTVVCSSASSGSYSSCSTSSTSSSSSITSSAGSSPQVVHAMPMPEPQHVYTVKMPGSPLIILTEKSSQSVSHVPTNTKPINRIVKTEKNAAPNRVPVLRLLPQNVIPATRPVVVSREVIESLNVPIVMQMPPLNENLTHVTVYTTYPKPLVVSTFSAKKVGNTLVFHNRRLNFIRSQFKSVLKKNRCGVPPRTPQTTIAQQPQTQTQTVFGVKTLNTNQVSRFPKQPASNHQPTSLLAHRPNILRTSAQTAKQSQHVPKILTKGLKRPASTPQITGIDCKYKLLNPTTANTNVSNVIGKIVVHQREVTDTGDGPATTSHLSLDKVVPVNMK